MAPRNTFHTFLSLVLIVPMMFFVTLGACSKSKRTGASAVGAAPVQSSDAVVGVSDDEASTALEDCDEDEKAEEEKEVEEEYEDEGSEDGAALKEKAKAKDKAGKSTKECPIPGTTAATGGTASLAEGQKIYTANCQGCHGALPGQKQGATAQTILSAGIIGPHNGVSPWPAAQASALSAQDAAASLAEAMK